MATLLLIAGITPCVCAAAQQPGRLPKIGVLSPGEHAAMTCESEVSLGNVGCFLEGLRALGYIDGRSVSLEYRFAEGAYDRLPALAAELVALRPDVIYTFTTPGAEAAAKATKTIPIVVASAAEPTMSKLAGNFARPTGNVTGTTLSSSEWDQKCLQLLKEMAPRTARVAVLLDPENPAWRGYPEFLRAAASQLGVTLIRVELRGASDRPQVFEAVTAARTDAIYMVNDSVVSGSADVRKQLIAWALSRSLPVASSSPRIAPDGGLMSYSTDMAVLARRGAHYVQRILAGAKPSDLPVELPTRFKLSVNLKTAKALGLTIPQSLLLRADEVIQ